MRHISRILTVYFQKLNNTRISGDMGITSVYIGDELQLLNLSLGAFMALNSFVWSVALMLVVFTSFRYATAH